MHTLESTVDQLGLPVTFKCRNGGHNCRGACTDRLTGRAIATPVQDVRSSDGRFDSGGRGGRAGLTSRS